jgi:ribosomal protein S18 acetylase RimI-like enzyme
MPRRLLITCVSPERPHPSGRLALRQKQQGVDVQILFENARSIQGLARDSQRLMQVLRRATYDEVQINVNGSIAQALAVLICRGFGLKTTLWMMDSYPGCLRYVTRYWFFFYPFFYLASAVAKLWAHQVWLIDEAFARHAPSWAGFRKRCVYVPLPQASIPQSFELTASPPTLGLLGNIEASWLASDFPGFYALARVHGYRVLVATSSSLNAAQFSQEGITTVIPWPKSETEQVFSECSAILVPLSVARLIYSSPSKIIDCYMRGIQPVVMTDQRAWDANRDRAIYQKCVHITEFFGEKKQYTPQELMAYSQTWATPPVVTESSALVGDSLSCRPATEDDLGSVTAVHMDAFPGFFLTMLGPAFVRTMYKAFLLNKSSIFLVNAGDAGVQGFVVGALTNLEQAKDRHLAVRLLPQFIWTVLPAVVRHPIRVLRRVVSQFLANEVAPNIPVGAAVLRSIGVTPGVRGRGTAGYLLQAFEQRAYASGATCVALTTDVLDNARAINFYRKHGYQIAKEFQQDRRRSMLLMLKELP